jgi:hypothetical protein
MRVNNATAHGTARTSNNDYVSTSGPLKVAAGQTTKTTTVKVDGDTHQEPCEYCAVGLSGASNGAIGVGKGVGTMVTDDGVGSRSTESAAAYAAAVDAVLHELSVSRAKSRRR